MAAKSRKKPTRLQRMLIGGPFILFTFGVVILIRAGYTYLMGQPHGLFVWAWLIGSVVAFRLLFE